MKAVICEAYGSPDVLQIHDVPKPVPKENEVLVKIRTTTVSVADCRVRGFRVPWLYWIPGRLILGLTKPKQPILGMEFAGQVAAVGKRVNRFRTGDQVMGGSGHDGGAHAEYICMAEDDRLTLKPAGLSYDQAAAFPFGGLTALHFLRKADVQPGQSVLVYGASGAVGSAAVQLARHMGARVTAVCSTTNLSWVRALGAERVIDYTREDFTTSGELYDVVFEAVGKVPFSKGRQAVRPGGVYLASVMVDIEGALRQRFTDVRIVYGGIEGSQADLRTLVELWEAGQFSPVIDRCYPFDAIAEAHRYVDTGRKKGNVVVEVRQNWSQTPPYTRTETAWSGQAQGR